MNMEPTRETKTITSPGGHAVVLKTYLTAREAQQVDKALYDAIKLEMGEGGLSEVKLGSQVSGAWLVENEKQMLSVTIVSLDGKAENVYEALLDLKQEDYNFILKEVRAVNKGNFQGPK